VDEIITTTVPWSRSKSKYRFRDYVAGEFPRLLRSLRDRHFDLAIDGHMDARNNMFLWLIRARRRLGFDYGGGRFFLTDLVKPDFGHPHHADLMVQLAKYAGGHDVLDGPEVTVSEQDRRAAQDFWSERGLENTSLVVGIHPGAGNPVRYWGLEKFAAVADKLAERHAVKFVCFCQPNGYGKEIPILSSHVTVSASLNEFMALVERCDLLLCNDGGPMHIATAVGTPVVAVFGAGEPRWWSPKGRDSEFVALGGFPCRPCFDHCKFDQPYCLTRLSVEQVLAVTERQVESLLSAPRRQRRHPKAKLAEIEP
jgi:ADP-heptose:LPS heptosyltransferase